MQTQYDKTDPGVNWFIIIPLLMLMSYIIFGSYINYLDAKASGYYTSCQSRMKNIATALEIYAENNNGKFPSKMEMLTPDYLSNIPTCEGYKAKFEIIRRRRLQYQDTYRVNDDFSIYTFYCASKDHHPVGVRDNYPQYSSIEGLSAK